MRFDCGLGFTLEPFQVFCSELCHIPANLVAAP